MNHQRTIHMPDRHHAAEVQPHSSRLTLVYEIVFLLFICGFLLQACDDIASTKERDDMVTNKPASAFHLKKPPIDLSAPAETETATFALG